MQKALHGSKVDSPDSFKVVGRILIYQALALIVTGWWLRASLNPDAVAYLQVAKHYAAGHWNLAISGYWSPLISWLIAPGYWLNLNPLIAGRLFMGISAIVFLLGCWRLLAHYKISATLCYWGLGAAALISVLWAGENITPDLLLAGLVCFAFVATVKRSPAAGFWWGVGYLCKSIALPLGLVTCLAMTAFDENGRLNPWRKLIRDFGITVIGIIIVAGAWVTIISIHDGKFTVSEAARMAHRRSGPEADEKIYVLDQGFEQPAPGRITTLENPSLHYPDWSPWESSRNAKHQWNVIRVNVFKSLAMITAISLAFPVLLVRWAVRVLRRTNRSPDVFEFGRLWIPVAVVALLYSPGYIELLDERYFYLALPFLLVLTAHELQQSRRWAASNLCRIIQTALLAFCFVVPNVVRANIYLPRSTVAGHEAVLLASRMSAARLAGPLAGSASGPGGRVGLYLAFLLQQPFYGDKPGASPQEYKDSKARFVVVIRDGWTARALGQTAGIENEDAKLFGSASEAESCPVQIWSVVSGQ